MSAPAARQSVSALTTACVTGADTWWSDIEGLVEEAERLIWDQAWAVKPADRTVAAQAAADLHAAVAPVMFFTVL